MAAGRNRTCPANRSSLLGVSRDITSRKRIAAEMQRQRDQLSHIQRVAVIEQLSAALAHEINQPLGAILRNIEAAELLLQNEAPDLDEVRDIIADVKLDVRRAASVIERLGALMKRQEFAVEAVPITDVINSTAELLRAVIEDRQVTLHVDLQPGLPWISGDRIQLQQVVLNLMVNGLEAMDGMTHGQRHLVVRASQPRQGIIEVAVIDRGIGIPADRAVKTFRAVPYHEGHGHRDRARHLTDDRRTARWSDLGREQPRGRGHLPLHVEAGRDGERVMTKPEPTVFVVDDDMSHLAGVERLLRAAGYLVRCYSSASAFLGERTDEARGCVVADLKMPGMDGLELQDRAGAVGQSPAGHLPDRPWRHPDDREGHARRRA